MGCEEEEGRPEMDQDRKTGGDGMELNRRDYFEGSSVCLASIMPRDVPHRSDNVPSCLVITVNGLLRLPLPLKRRKESVEDSSADTPLLLCDTPTPLVPSFSSLLSCRCSLLLHLPGDKPSKFGRKSRGR